MLYKHFSDILLLNSDNTLYINTLIPHILEMKKLKLDKNLLQGNNMSKSQSQKL